LPSQVGKWRRKQTDLFRILRRGVAGLEARVDSLRNGRKPEERKGQIDVIIRNVVDTRAGAVARDVSLLRRNAECGEIKSAKTAQVRRVRRQMPDHAVLGEIGIRMFKGCELPVQNGQYPRRLRREHQIFETAPHAQ
jgi:hypothetical protein